MIRVLATAGIVLASTLAALADGHDDFDVNQALLDPCALSHATPDSIVQAFSEDGWEEVTEGEAFDTGLAGSKEVTAALQSVHFEDGEDADAFLRSAHSVTQGRLMAQHNFVRGDLFLTIRVDDFRSTDPVYCTITGPALEAMSDQFDLIIPAVRPVPQSVGVSRTFLELERPERGIQPLFELVRIVYPEDTTRPFFAPVAMMLTTNLNPI